jgi:hypothetical protein
MTLKFSPTFLGVTHRVLHWVVVGCALYFVRVTELSAWSVFFALSAATVAIMILGSEMLYGFTEIPGMTLGRLLTATKA